MRGKVLKIGLVCPGGFETGAFGGIARYTISLAHGLVRMGHEVALLTPSPTKELQNLQEMKVVHLRLPQIPGGGFELTRWRFGMSLAVRRGLLDLMKNQEVDIVEAPDWGAASLLSGDFRDLPIVVRLHTPLELISRFEPQYYSRRPRDLMFSSKLERIASRGSVMISSPSSCLAEFATHAWSVPPDKIQVIPNGVDVEEIKRLQGARTEPSLVPIILFLGRLQQIKGIDVLLQVARDVVEEGIEVQFDLVGRLTGYAKSRIADLDDNHLQQIRFVGPVDHRAAIERMYSSNIVVVPSLFENFPLVCLEAMACRRAIAAARVGGIPEILEEGRLGLLFESGNAAQLKDAIVQLLEDKTLARRYGALAHDAAVRRYDLKECCRRSMALYERMLGG